MQATRLFRVSTSDRPSVIVREPKTILSAPSRGFGFLSFSCHQWGSDDDHDKNPPQGRISDASPHNLVTFGGLEGKKIGTQQPNKSLDVSKAILNDNLLQEATYYLVPHFSFDVVCDTYIIEHGNRSWCISSSSRKSESHDNSTKIIIAIFLKDKKCLAPRIRRKQIDGREICDK